MPVEGTMESHFTIRDMLGTEACTALSLSLDVKMHRVKLSQVVEPEKGSDVIILPYKELSSP
jgi:hypothetical protein